MLFLPVQYELFFIILVNASLHNFINIKIIQALIYDWLEFSELKTGNDCALCSLVLRRFQDVLCQLTEYSC